LNDQLAVAHKNYVTYWFDWTYTLIYLKWRLLWDQYIV